MVANANTIADLKAYSGPQPSPGDSLVFIVAGYHYPGDGGGGSFLFHDDPLPFTHYDEGLTFVTTNTDPSFAGVWYQRLVDTPYISVKWFGAFGDGYHGDSAAINRTFTAVRNYISGGINICTSGNTVIDIAASAGVVADRAFTRIYFPAGIYLIHSPIAIQDHGDPDLFYPYDAISMEILGENAIISPSISFDLDWTAMRLGPVGNTYVRGMTFKGFRQALHISGAGLPDIPGMNVTLDACTFSDIEQEALTIACPKSNIMINQTHWKNCRYGLVLAQGTVSIQGGFMQPAPWVMQYDTFIVNYGNLSMKGTTCNPPKQPFNQYAPDCAWVANHKNFRAVNVKFNAPILTIKPPPDKKNPGNISVNPYMIPQVGAILHNHAAGITWSDGAESENNRVTLRECYCDSSGPTIKMWEVPNSIIFEDNTSFGSRINGPWANVPLLSYVGTGTLQSKLDSLVGLFSLKMDNIPFLGIAGWQSIFLDQTHGLAILPFIRLNNGLDSYGYTESLGASAGPTILKFFQGKQSFDSSNVHNSAIHGDYSFEIKLSNIGDDGNIYEFNRYRVDVRIDFTGTPVSFIDAIDPPSMSPDNTNADAPVLLNDSNVLKVSTYTAGREYRVYYEIRCLVPPVVEPYAANP